MVAQNFKTKITRITSLLFFLGLYALFQLRNSSKLHFLRSEKPSTDLALNSNLFLNNFRLDPVIDIILPKESAFLSCLSPKNDVDTDLHCVYRVSGTEEPGMNFIRRVIVDGTTFRVKTPLSPNNIVEDKDLRAEDPRVFTWNDEAYVLNNNWMANNFPYTVDNFSFEGPVSIFHLARTNDGFGQVIDYFEGNFSDPISNSFFIKNITPIAVSDKRLIFIDFVTKILISCTRQNKTRFQFILNCIPLENSIFNYESNTSEEWHIRGGSAGFEISPGLYGGFGHLTNIENEHHHDIHFWTLDLTKKTNDGSIIPIVNTHHIMTDHDIDNQLTDPTSAFRVNGKWYLITTESTGKWHVGSLLVHRVYEINPVKA